MKKDYLKYIFHIIVIIGVIVAGVKYLNGEEVIEALRTFDYRYAPLILALSMGSFLVKGWRFIILMQSISNLPAKTVMKGYIAGQAVVLLPGGIAARAGLMGQAGGDVAKSGVPVVFASGLDQVVFITSSLIAALWFEEARLTILSLLGILLLIGLTLLISRTRNWLLGACHWTACKLNALDNWQKFLQAIPEVATFRTISISLAIAFVAFILDVNALNFSLRGVGFPLPLHQVFIAYVLPLMLGRIIPVPGGFGVTEAGMVGFLVSVSTISAASAAAAVAIFRIGTVVFEVVLGAFVYFFMWGGEKEASKATAAISEREKNLASNT